MVDDDRREPHAVQGERRLGLDLVELDRRQQVVGQAGEIRPRGVVEQVAPQGVDGGLRGVQRNRLAAQPDKPSVLLLEQVQQKKNNLF